MRSVDLRTHGALARGVCQLINKGLGKARKGGILCLFK